MWPGYVHFPDFFHPNASAYWLLQLEKWHEVVDYDGVWLDMNEPSNFCDGECPPDCAKEHMFECKAVRGPEQERTRMLYAPWRLRQHGGRAFDPSHPPYIPGGAPSLDIKTVSMTARQCVQEPPIPYTSSCISALHYDTHNLYGISEARVTSGALEKILKRRSLIISRSTFPGSGKYGGAWLGDSDASWEDMRLSISGILTMGMLGIPLVGADICGFAGNTTRELCIRWSQLGSMYPFSRNHNDLKSISQEPYAFDQEALDIIKGALLTRYRLFPYMYTLFGEAHATGVPVARSLLMEFPGMVEIAAHVEDQFLLGHALMVSPVLSAGAIAVNMYLPPARWYDFYTGAELMGSPGWVHIVAPLSSLLLHVRGGTIIPMQQPKTTTAEVRASNFTLVAALSEDYRAIGNILLDDGETMTSDSLYKSLHITVQAAAGLEGEIGNMTTTVSGMYSPSSDPGISKDLKVRTLLASIAK